MGTANPRLRGQLQEEEKQTILLVGRSAQFASFRHIHIDILGCYYCCHRLQKGRVLCAVVDSIIIS